jgi:hypothetical protein
MTPLSRPANLLSTGQSRVVTFTDKRNHNLSRVLDGHAWPAVLLHDFFLMQNSGESSYIPFSMLLKLINFDLKPFCSSCCQ